MRTVKDKAWKDLERLAPGDVCRRSLADFDHTAHAYTVVVFGHSVTVKSGQRTIEGRHPDCDPIVNGMGYFSHLAILHHLWSVAMLCVKIMLPPPRREDRP